MRPYSYQQAQQQRPRYQPHLGGVAEAVGDPGDTTTSAIPDASDNQCGRAPETAFGIEKVTRLSHPRKQQNRSDDKQRHGNRKAHPMKTACQSIHGASLRFTTSTCLLTPISARGPAVATLVSFALMAWVIAGGAA